MEITARLESTAKIERRQWVARGYNVSLIAYDSNRQLYAFDVIDFYDGPTNQPRHRKGH